MGGQQNNYAIMYFVNVKEAWMRKRQYILIPTTLVSIYSSIACENAIAESSAAAFVKAQVAVENNGKTGVSESKKRKSASRDIIKQSVKIAEKSEEISVTGTRIRKSTGGGNPLTTVTAKQLSILSPESLPAGLAKIPLFQPIKSSDSASDGGYQPTGNYLDLWGLGPIRTLVLEDGHRVAPTYYTGTVDVNTLPQMLVKKVEIVTGGGVGGLRF